MAPDQLSKVLDELAEIRAEHRYARETLDRLAYAIEGNGKPGLKTQVDRLEQKWGVVAWISGAAMVATIGIWVKAFWAAMKGTL